MPQKSAGLLLYRCKGGAVEVLLVHPGGPFFSKKDDGAWTIPKGVCEPGEDALAAARREFKEETGMAPAGEFIPLGKFRQSSSKIVLAWAVEGEFDATKLASNMFSLEWPPRSGRVREFPEIDRAGWFSPAEARRKILKGQAPILDALLARLKHAP